MSKSNEQIYSKFELEGVNIGAAELVRLTDTVSDILLYMPRIVR